MKPWAEKWIAIGLKTGETDWDTFDKYMPVCYEKAGLVYPSKVIRVQSPLVGALASSVAEAILKKRRDAVNDAVDDAVSGAIHVAIGGAVNGAVNDAIHDAIGGAVGGAVGGAISDAVNDAVNDAIGGAVDGAVSDAVGGAVSDAVGRAVDGVSDAVRTAVSIALKAGVNLAWHHWLGGQFWVGGWYWGNAFASFFTDVCGLVLNKDITERMVAYRKVNESVNYIWPNRDFVMVCARPIKIERNAQGRLHSTTGKSIEYPDGFGLYHLNGVRFDEALFKQVTSGTMPFADIVAIKDIDQRTQAMRFGDVWEFMKLMKGECLDKMAKERSDGTQVRYWLYKIPKNDTFTQDAFFAIYDDLVPGSGKQYMSGVEPCKTVSEAMSWKFSDDVQTLTPAEWLKLIPGVSMN